MCIVCTGEYNRWLTKLVCCPNVTEIPNIKSLERLDVVNNYNIVKIPKIRRLKELYCYGCTKLKEIPSIKGLKCINCAGCKSIKNIPYIKNLKVLNCSDINIVELPYIKGLKTLYCAGCKFLTKIPFINLNEVWCMDCRMLTEVNTYLFNSIETREQERETTNIIIRSFIACRGCPWIFHNTQFEFNLEKLVFLQRFFKKWLWFLHLKRYVLSKEFRVWYYAPDGPEGKNAIRRLNLKTSYDKISKYII